MSKLRATSPSLFLLLLCATAALAQSEIPKSVYPEALTVTAYATSERVRFAAPPSVVQFHLQVYSDAGQVLFDASSKGNVLDWSVQDGSGARLPAGSYLCVVTVKTLAGKLSQKIAELSVQEQQTALRSIEAAQLTVAQQREVGPVTEDAALAILKDDVGEAATVIAHDGTEGQLIRGQGALSFRLGDFFRGTEVGGIRVEGPQAGGTGLFGFSMGGLGGFGIDAVNNAGGRFLVREDGNVGIGATTPQAKLDVRGDVKLGSTGQFFAPGGEENLRIIRGVVDGAGNVIAGHGFTVTHPNEGIFVISFKTAFSGPPAIFAMAAGSTGGEVYVAMTGGVTGSQATIAVVAPNNETVLIGPDHIVRYARDQAFHFTAIGPR